MAFKRTDLHLFSRTVIKSRPAVSLSHVYLSPMIREAVVRNNPLGTSARPRCCTHRTAVSSDCWMPGVEAHATISIARHWPAVAVDYLAGHSWFNKVRSQ